MKKGRLYTLIAFIILVLAGAAYTLNHLYEQEQQEEASYRTESPSTGDIVIKTVAAGSIQPRQEILIKPQISGIVRRVMRPPRRGLFNPCRLLHKAQIILPLWDD